MSLAVAENPRVIVDPEGFVIVPDDFTWADLPAGGWIGDELAAMPVRQVSTKELIDAAATAATAATWEKLAAWAAGNQAKVPAEFGARRDSELEAEVADLSEAAQEFVLESDFAAEEVSVALSVAPGTARARMEFARELVQRLPGTVAGMITGVVSWSKARTILDQTEDLDPQQTAELEEKILAWGAGKTPGQVRDKLRREILRIDPDAAARWRREATRKRNVSLNPLPDGMADLRIHLPGADAVLVYNWLDEHARAVKSTGDERSLDDPVTGALTDIDPTRYTPPAALKAFVQDRDRTCRFPTCRQPAHRSDIDHTIPFHSGHEPGTEQNPGTARGNLGVLCRRHHRLKDDPFGTWQFEQTTEGRFRWTTPEGRDYRVDPDPPHEPPQPPEPEIDDSPPPF